MGINYIVSIYFPSYSTWLIIVLIIEQLSFELCICLNKWSHCSLVLPSDMMPTTSFNFIFATLYDIKIRHDKLCEYNTSSGEPNDNHVKFFSLSWAEQITAAMSKTIGRKRNKMETWSKFYIWKRWLRWPTVNIFTFYCQFLICQKCFARNTDIISANVSNLPTIH